MILYSRMITLWEPAAAGLEFSTLSGFGRGGARLIPVLLRQGFFHA